MSKSLHPTLALKLHQKAKNECNERLKSEFTPSLDILRGETPHYKDAFQVQSVGDEATGQLMLVSIPIIDKSNGDYTTLAAFANEMMM